MIVYVVVISDVDNGYFKIYAAYSSEEEALNSIKELESSLTEDMVVSCEAVEVYE